MRHGEGVTCRRAVYIGLPSSLAQQPRHGEAPVGSTCPAPHVPASSSLPKHKQCALARCPPTLLSCSSAHLTHPHSHSRPHLLPYEGRRARAAVAGYADVHADARVRGELEDGDARVPNGQQLGQPQPAAQLRRDAVQQPGHLRGTAGRVGGGREGGS
mgnify:CR=1 FL=1